MGKLAKRQKLKAQKLCVTLLALQCQVGVQKVSEMQDKKSKREDSLSKAEKNLSNLEQQRTTDFESENLSPNTLTYYMQEALKLEDHVSLNRLNLDNADLDLRKHTQTLFELRMLHKYQTRAVKRMSKKISEYEEQNSRDNEAFLRAMFGEYSE